MKVLYAEDDYGCQVLMETYFEKRDIQCDVVEDGLTAYRLFDTYAYDLVVLDEYMPVLKGHDVAQKIRSNASTVPLIAVTSDDSPETKHLLLESGFTDVMIKPVRKDKLDLILSKYL